MLGKEISETLQEMLGSTINDSGEHVIRWVKLEPFLNDEPVDFFSEEALEERDHKYLYGGNSLAKKTSLVEARLRVLVRSEDSGVVNTIVQHGFTPPDMTEDRYNYASLAPMIFSVEDDEVILRLDPETELKLGASIGGQRYDTIKVSNASAEEIVASKEHNGSLYGDRPQVEEYDRA